MVADRKRYLRQGLANPTGVGRDQAEMFLRAIKDELETNERLIEDFGAFYSKPKYGSPKVWKACDTFRGSIDPSIYKDYVLTMLFIKYLSKRKLSFFKIFISLF
jgi:hypothetical protein